MGMDEWGREIPVLFGTSEESETAVRVRFSDFGLRRSKCSCSERSGTKRAVSALITPQNSKRSLQVLSARLS